VLERELYIDSLDRAAVARIGTMCTLAQEWNDPGAAADREIVEMNRPTDYGADVWDVVVEAAANRPWR
jgi:hypothetical protein